MATLRSNRQAAGSNERGLNRGEFAQGMRRGSARRNAGGRFQIEQPCHGQDQVLGDFAHIAGG
jgi:hypothetical protein